MGGTNVPTTPAAGTVYFSAHNDDNTLGSVYYGDASGKRREIIPTKLDCGTVSLSECCFIRGTKISMADGSFKNIEDIKKGDKVFSYNPLTKIFYESVVKSLIINRNTIDLATVYFDNGKELHMNAYHPILTENGFHSLTNYNDYDTLQIGDLAITEEGKSNIIGIERISLRNPILTFNLDVQDIDEYIDDDKNDTFIANGIVVHNAACPT